MSAQYVIVLVHHGLYDFAEDFMRSVRDVTEELFGQTHLVCFREEVLTEDQESSSLAVYLGNRSGRHDHRVKEVLCQALADQLPIFPIVRESDDGGVHEKVPAIIARINAANWTENRASALTEILGVLGLVDAERKVFLSYVRRETSPVALQLHKALVQNRFDVFLDRFAVPPGADFQSRLDEELGDKAFVVLLESPGLKTSRWVRHEIAYAHSHRISVLSLAMPEVGDAELVSVIDDAFRVRLSAADLRRLPHDLGRLLRGMRSAPGGRLHAPVHAHHGDRVQPRGDLTATTLSTILERIETAHARSLRRRREQLVGSIVDSARRDGCACDAVADWAILVTADGRRPAVFLVTPRRPQPKDLLALDRIRRRIASNADSSTALAAAVAHDVHMPVDHQRLMDWIGEPRELGVRRLLECDLEVM